MSLKKKFKRSKNRFVAIFRNPIFWGLTFSGNVIIFLGAAILMVVEAQAQAKPLQYIDYLLWSAGLVTTIGYGDYMALTGAGKVIIFFMMLLGTLFIWSYMAFLVTGLFTPELSAIEKEVHALKNASNESLPQ